MSRPMYETTLTGLPSSVHGITNNQIIRPSRFPNLFSLCRENGLTTAAAAYQWMSELYSRPGRFDPLSDRYQLEGEGSICHGIFYYEDQYPDTHLFGDGEFLRRTYHPDFLLFHSMNVDYWGHQRGSGSPEYAQAVAAVMEHIAQLLPPWLEEGWQVVITADHGNAEEMRKPDGSPMTAHTTNLVPFILVGADAKLRPGRLADIAPTILDIMGLACPPEMDGKSLIE